MPAVDSMYYERINPVHVIHYLFPVSSTQCWTQWLTQIRVVEDKNHRTNTKNEKTIGMHKANGLHSHEQVELLISEIEAIVSFVVKWLKAVFKQICVSCK